MGRADAVKAERGDEGHGLPTAMGLHCLEALASRTPVAKGHVGFDPCLVDAADRGRGDPQRGVQRADAGDRLFVQNGRIRRPTMRHLLDCALTYVKFDLRQ